MNICIPHNTVSIIIKLNNKTVYKSEDLIFFCMASEKYNSEVSYGTTNSISYPIDWKGFIIHPLVKCCPLKGPQINHSEYLTRYMYECFGD